MPGCWLLHPSPDLQEAPSMLISHPMTDTLGSHPRHSPDYVMWPALPQHVVRDIRSQLGSRCERKLWLLAPHHVSGFLLMWSPHLYHFLFLRHFLLQPGLLSSCRRSKLLGWGWEWGSGMRGVGVGSGESAGWGCSGPAVSQHTFSGPLFYTPNFQLIKNALGHVKGKYERVVSI